MKNPRVHRTDGDYPVAWSKTHGKGRVFYATLGHAPESWDNPQIQKMYFEALKWVMGLSEGETKPLAGK
jgi:type 1 glutamine amidotransferase